MASIFFELFPRVMVSSTNSAYNLTVANSASPSYTLKVMTVVAVIFFPVILLYQGWSLYIFRKRISGGPPSVVAAPVEPDDPPAAPTQDPDSGGRGGSDPGQAPSPPEDAARRRTPVARPARGANLERTTSGDRVAGRRAGPRHAGGRFPVAATGWATNRNGPTPATGRGRCTRLISPRSGSTATR